MNFNVTLGNIILISVSVLVVMSLFAFFMYKLISVKLCKWPFFIGQTKKETILEIDYTISKYMRGLAYAEETSQSQIESITDSTVDGIINLVLFEYGNVIDSKWDTYEVNKVQDLIELYLARDLRNILQPKLKQAYYSNPANSTEQSDLTDLVEDLTHTLIDSMVLGIKRYTYVSKLFGNIESVLVNSTRKIFDELRISIGKLSIVRNTYDTTINTIKTDAKERVYRLIEGLSKVENDGANV